MPPDGCCQLVEAFNVRQSVLGSFQVINVNAWHYRDQATVRTVNARCGGYSGGCGRWSSAAYWHRGGGGMAAVFHTALCPFIPWYVHMTGDCNLCAVSACLIQLRESGHCLGLPRWWGGGGGAGIHEAEGCCLIVWLLRSLTIGTCDWLAPKPNDLTVTGCHVAPALVLVQVQQRQGSQRGV